MMDVEIRYNPYKVITTIKVDGEAPKDNSKITQFLNQRIQMWVDKIPALLAEEYNDDDFNLIFYGTDPDYQDLLSALKEEERNGIHFSAKKMPIKEFGDKETKVQELFERIKGLPFEGLQSDAVKNAFSSAFKGLLEVNVVATMSAGKSTLINAMLGRKLMPSKQGACTATITKIQDDDDQTFKATVRDGNETEIEHYSVLDYKTMMSLNQNPEVSVIEAFGNIPFVKSEEVSLVLIDTPGPDNARDKRHGEVTERALKASSKMLVLFVMNGGKLHDEAQDSFLRKIAKSMSVGGKQSRDRFMFIINKMDAYDEEDDDIANETIPDTIKYLEDMGIDNPNIFPTAAEPALLIRRYLNSHDESERSALLKKIQPVVDKMISQRQLHLEQYAKLPKECQVIIEGELETALREHDFIRQVLVHTGIRGIEENIRMYVTKYCRPAKITNIVNTLQTALKDAKAFEITRAKIDSCEAEREELDRKISELVEKLTSKKENEAFKVQIANLQITSELARSVDALIIDVEKNLTDFFFNCEAEMEEDDAMVYIRRFGKLATEKQNEFEVAVESLLEKDIQQKGQQLLDEYIRKLDAISKECQLNGLNIDLVSFVRGRLASLDEDIVLDNSVDSRIEEHTEERTTTITKRRTGWDRVRHISSWVHPEYEVIVHYDVKVEEEIKYISREKLSNQLIAPIRKQLFSERARIFEYAAQETVHIKDFFFTQFFKVDIVLAKLASKLREDLQSKETAEAALAEANHRLDKLKEIQAMLDDILDI